MSPTVFVLIVLGAVRAVPPWGPVEPCPPGTTPREEAHAPDSSGRAHGCVDSAGRRQGTWITWYEGRDGGSRELGPTEEFVNGLKHGRRIFWDSTKRAGAVARPHSVREYRWDKPAGLQEWGRPKEGQWLFGPSGRLDGADAGWTRTSPDTFSSPTSNPRRLLGVTRLEDGAGIRVSWREDGSRWSQVTVDPERGFVERADFGRGARGDTPTRLSSTKRLRDDGMCEVRAYWPDGRLMLAYVLHWSCDESSPESWHGPRSEWSEDGKLELTQHFLHGLPVGVREEYTPGGWVEERRRVEHAERRERSEGSTSVFLYERVTVLNRKGKALSNSCQARWYEEEPGYSEDIDLLWGTRDAERGRTYPCPCRKGKKGDPSWPACPKT